MLCVSIKKEVTLVNADMVFRETVEFARVSLISTFSTIDILTTVVGNLIESSSKL